MRDIYSYIMTVNYFDKINYLYCDKMFGIFLNLYRKNWHYIFQSKPYAVTRDINTTKYKEKVILQD